MKRLDVHINVVNHLDQVTCYRAGSTTRIEDAAGHIEDQVRQDSECLRGIRRAVLIGAGHTRILKGRSRLLAMTGRLWNHRTSLALRRFNRCYRSSTGVVVRAIMLPLRRTRMAMGRLIASATMSRWRSPAP